MSLAWPWRVWWLKTTTIFRGKLYSTYREIFHRQTKWFIHLFPNWTVLLSIRILAMLFPIVHLVMIPFALIRILQHIHLQPESVGRRLWSTPISLFQILTVNQDMRMSFLPTQGVLHPSIIKLWRMGIQVFPPRGCLRSFSPVAFLPSIR